MLKKLFFTKSKGKEFFAYTRIVMVVSIGLLSLSITGRVNPMYGLILLGASILFDPSLMRLCFKVPADCYSTFVFTCFSMLLGLGPITRNPSFPILAFPCLILYFIYQAIRKMQK